LNLAFLKYSPEKIITIPLSMLQVVGQLLPKRAKSALEKEGIDLTQCKDLAKEKGLCWNID
jgi:hypothetical protein